MGIPARRIPAAEFEVAGSKRAEPQALTPGALRATHQELRYMRSAEPLAGGDVGIQSGEFPPQAYFPLPDRHPGFSVAHGRRPPGETACGQEFSHTPYVA